MSVQNASVCTFKTSPFVLAPRAHMLKHVCAWCWYTRGRFERTHGDVLSGHTGFRSVSHTTHTHMNTHTTPQNNTNTTQHNTAQHNTTQHNTTRPQHHTEIDRDRQRQTETDRDRKKTGTEREEKTEEERQDKRREDKRRQDKTREESRLIFRVVVHGRFLLV